MPGQSLPIMSPAPSARLLLLLFFLLSLHHPSLSATVTVRGCFQCNVGTPRPIERASFSVFDHDTLGDDKLGSGVTDSAGCFSVTGEGGDGIGLSGRDPDVFVRLYYHHESPNGSLRIKKYVNAPSATYPFFRRDQRQDDTPRRNDVSGDVDYGTIVLSNSACVNYVHFLDAVDAYKIGTNESLPYSELEVTVELLDSVKTILGRIPGLGGLGALVDAVIRVPFAPYDRVMVPAGYAMSADTAKHELAHTVRHVFDGSLTHFLSDALRYEYPQSHTCTKKTNEGFAFNEGLANWNYGSTCGDADGPKDIEGNVAVALTRLQSTCGLSYKDVWSVLESNPGRIHSLREFEAAACPTAATPPPATAAPATTTTTTVATAPPQTQPQSQPLPGGCASIPTLRLYAGYESRGLGHLQPQVRFLQTLLNALVGAGLQVDGYFGQATLAAVKRFQTERGLAVDGVVGPQTWGALCS